MRSWTVALGASLAFLPMTAEACTFTWERGYSPREIRENSELLVVTGTFRFVQDPATGRLVTDSRGWPYGRIESPRGQHWNTVQLPLYEISIECGAYTAPTGNDATGTFWIARERENGRHWLLMWEPRYPPSPPPARRAP